MARPETLRLKLRIALAGLFLLAFAHAGAVDSVTESERVFAKIDDLVISESEFEQIFAAAVRHRYYHGSVPAQELEDFRRKVGEDIVTQVLVYREAQRLGLEPDRARIEAGIEAFDTRNANNPDWQNRRDRVIPRLVERIERQDLIEALERRVRDIPGPAAAEVLRYYREHPEKFTEPRQSRLSVILLGVPPHAGESNWQAAIESAAALQRRVEAGESFAALARRHSSHASAAAGGDLGLLHDGVLEEAVQQRLETLEVGELSGPLRVLEGIALFRLDGVQAPRLRDFSAVRERARQLLQRERQDVAWSTYVENLRAAAQVNVNR